jgi:hypothetical protein
MAPSTQMNAATPSKRFRPTWSRRGDIVGSVGNDVRTGPVELRYTAEYKTAANPMINAHRATTSHDIGCCDDVVSSDPETVTLASNVFR